MKTLFFLVCVGAVGCGVDSTAEIDESITGVTQEDALASGRVASASCSGGAACTICRALCRGEARPSFCDDTHYVAPTDLCLRASDTGFSNAPEAKLPAVRFHAEGSQRDSVESFLRPVVLLPYMRALRNLASADATYRSALDNQVAYLWSRATHFRARGSNPEAFAWQTTFHGSSGTKHYVQALSEAGWASFLLTVASGERDDARRADVLRKVLLLDAALERDFSSDAGGVLRRAPDCGPDGFKGACWYFHSRAPLDQAEAGTALNQSLHVLNDAAAMLRLLSTWPYPWPSNAVVTKEALVARLQRRLENGLMQWAYGVEAPTLKSAMWRVAPGMAWSWYEYDVANQRGANNVTAEHVCHYHTVTLTNLAGLLRAIDPALSAESRNVVALLGASAARIEAARRQVLTYTKAGVPETLTATTGTPLFQWFRAEEDAALRNGPGLRCDRFPAERALNDVDHDGLKSYLCAQFSAAKLSACQR